MKKRVLILTYGSTGDVQPYLNLACQIQEQHQVFICTNKKFQQQVSSAGFDFLALSDEISDFITSTSGKSAMANLNSFWGMLKSIPKLAGKISRIQKELIKDAWQAVQDCKPDIIIFNPKTHFASHFADKHSTKLLCLPLFPQLIPTRDFAPIGFPNWRYPYLNWLSYQFVIWSGKFITGKHINNWRAQVGLNKASATMDILAKPNGKPIPVLNAYSPNLLPQPNDYPTHVKTIGFFNTTKEQSWTPPEHLMQFLSEYPKPIYIGFGSMASSNAEGITKLIIKVLTRHKISAIIATGWGGLTHLSHPEHIHFVESLPHSWLFSRVSAVVHHGGAGTTAATLKAGLPSLVCPVFGDQFLWGDVLFKHQLGVKPLPQKKFTEESFEVALLELLNTPSLAENARSFAEKMQLERGTDKAANKVNALLQQ